MKERILQERQKIVTEFDSILCTAFCTFILLFIYNNYIIINL